MGIPISDGNYPIAILAILISGLFAYSFYEIFVPRSLSGLQVAFPTGPKKCVLMRA